MPTLSLRAFGRGRRRDFLRRTEVNERGHAYVAMALATRPDIAHVCAIGELNHTGSEAGRLALR
jgi:hypothetical protein